MEQKFGGHWTIQKLDVFQKYLATWLGIFNRNANAQWYRKIYVDGFAGSGHVRVRYRKGPGSGGLEFPEVGMQISDVPSLGSPTRGDLSSIFPGSAKIALDASPGFDEYILVESNARNSLALRKLRDTYGSQRSVRVVQGDCNDQIQKWISTINPRKDRALVLLDPFALEVSWQTLRGLAETEAVDLWLLFPLMGVQRLMPKKGLPGDRHSRILDDLFGGPDWLKEFYAPTGQLGLFGEEVTHVKMADTIKLCRFLVHKLNAIYPHVVQEPMILRNSKQAPLFCFVFAAANPKKGKRAVEIAQDIVQRAIREGF